MRIDVESTGFRPGFHPQKVSGEINELKNRGESVRGLVLDISDNMVLIQSSSGKQFSAKTTIPLENYLGQEISFTLILSPEGELLLVPDLDKNQKKILDLKIEDILTKFGKQINEENKNIVAEMIKSGMPVTKDSFEEIKSLNLALKTIKNGNYILNLNQEQIETPIDDLSKSLQIKKDFGQEQKAENFELSKNVDLKDIVFLKNIDMLVNLKNLNSISDLFQRVDNGNTDIIGLNEIIENLEKEISHNKELSQKSDEIAENNVIKNKDSAILTEMTEEIKANFYKEDRNVENLSFKDMETLNKLNNNLLFKNLGDDLFSLIKNSDNSKEIVLNILKNINKNIQKEINSRDVDSEDIKLKYEKISEAIKEVGQALSKENALTQRIENDILPKMDILSNLSTRYNFNVVPYILDNKYENVLQFFVKKDAKKKKFLKKDWIVGISINTNNYGLIKTSLKMKQNKNLSIDFIVKDKSVINLIKENENLLLKPIELIGFKNVNINIRDKKDEPSEKLLDDALYKNSNIKTFEAWV